MHRPDAKRRYTKGLGPLQDLLLESCPVDAKGEISIRVLSAHLGISCAAVYRWLSLGRIPAARARKCVALAEGRVTWSDFERYVS